MSSTARQDERLEVVEWAVQCCHTIILGGGGAPNVLEACAVLGLRSAAAYLATLARAPEDDHPLLAEVATSGLRLTALAMREDAVSSALPIDVLRAIKMETEHMPVPPLPMMDPPCEFELVIDTIRSTVRSRIMCYQFLAHR